MHSATRKRSTAAIVMASALSAAVPVAAGETSGTALTIYSTLQPGAVPPELYRDGGRGPAVPGYAVVRN